MEIVIHPTFVDAMFQIQLQDEIYNQNIVDFKNYLQDKNSVGIIRSNSHAWQHDVSKGQCHEIDKMISLVEYNISDIFNNFYKLPCNIELANMWLNENPRGGSNQYHTHPGCIFSGVYYVSSNETPEQGEIMFQRDTHHLYADIQTRALQQDEHPPELQQIPEIRTNAAFTAQEGSAFVFPPFFNHCVTENKTDDPRLVIGMNFVAYK